MMQIVIVKWLDAFGCSSSWRERDDIEKATPSICESVGWLIKDEDDYIVLVPHVANETLGSTWQGCGDMTIPRAAIQRINPLTPARSE